MAYPIELRQKAIEYYRQCQNASQVCRVYGISDKTLSSWLRLYEQTGSLAHQVKGGNATKIDRQQLSDYLEQHPDAYLHEIAEHLGCSPPNVSYLLKVMGITRKKKTTTYKEQKPEQVAAYQQALSQYTDYQAVFLDETGFDTFFYRPYAYSKKGVPVKAQISGRKYQRISLVAAQIQGKGSLIAPMTYCGTMDGSLFEAWFEQMLMPELTEKSVIIMDNARFHRMAVLAEMAQKQGHKVLPLAPYSPELNPIEKVWANIKKHLRKVLPAVGDFMTALLRSSYFN